MSKFDRPEYRVAIAQKVMEGKGNGIIAREMAEEGMPINRSTLFRNMQKIEQAGGLVAFINKARAEIVAENMEQVKQNWSNILRGEGDFTKEQQYRGTVEMTRGVGVFADFKYIHEEQHVFEHKDEEAVSTALELLNERRARYKQRRTTTESDSVA